MGLRNALARWLHSPAAPVVGPDTASLLARIEKLELERPAFIAELENLLESCTEILDRAGAQRARTAARESREKKAHAEEQPAVPDRDQVKANVRALLRQQGKLP